VNKLARLLLHVQTYLKIDVSTSDQTNMNCPTVICWAFLYFAVLIIIKKCILVVNKCFYWTNKDIFSSETYRIFL